MTADTDTGPSGTVGDHLYLSTACLHGQHEHCRSATAVDGQPKVPGTCKFCDAVCVCEVCGHNTPERENPKEKP